MSPWQVWVDTGGTFTDCLALDPGGRLHRAKVLSHGALRGRVAHRLGPSAARVDVAWRLPPTFLRGYRLRPLRDAGGPGATVVALDPVTGRLVVDGVLPDGAIPGAAFEVSAGEEAPVLAARLVTGTPLDRPLPAMALRLATTRGTNALLERKVVPTALFVTRGFGDLLEIGDQRRPDLFALDIRKPWPLCAAVVEVDERLDARGQVVRPLSLAGLTERVAELRAQGVGAAAVALLHSYRNPVHEGRLEGFLRDAGFATVSTSSSLAPLVRILPRAQSAVVDACLGPILGAYLERVAAPVTGTVHAMTSAGGLVARGAYRARDSLLSGPAGGVAGAAAAGRRSGCNRILSFDMGGTSTDVARVDGDFEYDFEHAVGDVRLAGTALAIETVAAGGGSICRYLRGRLAVGPESAGADPGPACYGAGGPLTVTDVNLLLGRLDPERFEIPICLERAREGLEGLRRDLAADGPAPPAEQVMAGLVAIADERMAAAIRRVSLQKGYDPAQYTLVAFGGAGGQHVCGVASRLGARQALVPRDASLLSAAGLGAAVVERFAERQVLRPLDEVESHLPTWFDELGDRARAEVLAEGVLPADVVVRRRLASLRFAGQESTLTTAWDGRPAGHAFAAAYEGVYGHRPDANRPIEVESIRAVASSRPPPEAPPAATPDPTAAIPAGRRRVWTDAGWLDAPTFERAGLAPGATAQGPALVFERHSCTFVEAGWALTVDGAGALSLRRAGTGAAPERVSPAAVRRALFTHALEGCAREMGTMLSRTALSTNVKERLDFSCAVLDARGRLVANAPHIPVHLGALGLCVRAVAAALPLQPGDTAVTNHPGFGGSHLPDITLVTPVHGPSGGLLAYVASRAHHAELGGRRPGSMPPEATRLTDEGVVLAPRLLARGGVALWPELRRLLEAGPHPSRAVADNLADLEAALAANHRGRLELLRLAAAHGEADLTWAMDGLRAEAAAGVRAALARVGQGRYEAREALDDGSAIQVAVEVAGEGAVVDFSGSAPVHGGNLNATPAIVHSAVIYVLRLLIDAPLPLNEGLLEPVSIRLPAGMLNPPFTTDGDGPAVGGGNVETSQRLVDVLLKALRLAAGSQGTMNNTLFGGDRFGYYETVCGGAGAGPGFDGAHAVHTHMTNTRITDVEIVEQRYPVRVERFAVRRGSGGAGRWRGGDGVVRELRFLAPVSLSLLTQRRREGPYGVDGGAPGAPGRQRVVRADGSVETLGSVDGRQLQAGDRLVLETPGGGGWGPPDPDRGETG